MGMYDYIKCEMPLPKTVLMPGVFGELFQTKDTPDQYLTTYTITRQGRLMWRPYTMEVVPEEKRPYPNGEGILKFCGMMKRIEKEPEIVEDFHRDLIFYQYHSKDKMTYWWEYKARFTDGVCKKIDLLVYEVKPAKVWPKREIKTKKQC